MNAQPDVMIDVAALAKTKVATVVDTSEESIYVMAAFEHSIRCDFLVIYLNMDVPPPASLTCSIGSDEANLQRVESRIKLIDGPMRYLTGRVRQAFECESTKVVIRLDAQQTRLIQLQLHTLFENPVRALKIWSPWASLPPSILKRLISSLATPCLVAESAPIFGVHINSGTHRALMRFNSSSANMPPPWGLVMRFLPWLGMLSMSMVNKQLAHIAPQVWKTTDGRAWHNFSILRGVRVSASSRWSQHDVEDPKNVVDASTMTWWSSAMVDTCTMRIVLPQPVPLERLVLLWGDDAGRIRPASKHFRIFCEHNWGRTLVHESDRVILREASSTSTAWRNVLDDTSTTVDINMVTREVTIEFLERQRHWRNHAINSVLLLGRGRRGDFC